MKRLNELASRDSVQNALRKALERRSAYVPMAACLASCHEAQAIIAAANAMLYDSYHGGNADARGVERALRSSFLSLHPDGIIFWMVAPWNKAEIANVKAMIDEL